MKISLAFPGCHKRAGVEKIMLECANFLARRGHETVVYAAEIDRQALEPAVSVRQIRMPRIRLAPALGFFDRAVARQRLLDTSDAFCTFGAVCPPGGVLWVQSVHQSWLEISQATRDLPGRIKQICNPAHPLLIRREQLHFGERRYKKLIALTAEVSADLQRLYNVPPEDIRILPNGFSPSDFNLQKTMGLRSEQRKQLGYNSTDKVVVFVANELERKGFGPLVEAIALLKDENIKLLVVGNVTAGSYERKLKELGLKGRTQFVGPSAQVWKLYAAADLFALPTKYEAWGMVIVEAMACGLPAVTTRVAGASVAVQQGENGLLIDNALDSFEIAAMLRQAIYELQWQPERISASVQRYAWDEILSEYESYILDVPITSCVRP